MPDCKVCGFSDVRVVNLRPTRQDQGVDSGCFIPTAGDFGVPAVLAKCRHCGFVSSLDAQAGSAAQHYAGSEDSLYVAQAEQRKWAFGRVLDDLTALVKPPADLLDVGCSYGLFLNSASSRGYRVKGIDPSRDACGYCADKLKLPVVQATIERAGFPADSWDVITALEVIEHLPDPKIILQQAYAWLKPGGIFYMVTPDLSSLSAKICGYRWWSYRRMHLSYFSAYSLRLLLNAYGFSLLKVKPYKKRFSLAYIFKQAARLGGALPYRTGKRVLPGCFNPVQLDAFVKWPAKINLTLSYGDIAVIARKRA